ncbi:phage minor head protein [Methanobrevibacter sp.]
MSILREELITNHLLLDYFDLWDEFDIKSANDTQEVRYYNLLMNLINGQIDAGIRWLNSDDAKEYFKGETEYQREVFQALEDEWDSILESKYNSVDALLSEVYRRGKAKGYSDMRSRIRYTEQDKLALDFVTNYNFGLIRNIDFDTRSQIKAKITEAVIAGEHPYTVAPKILDVAEEKLDGSNFTPKQRATMIARTEVSRVQNTGILQSYINEGYTEVKILTAEDDHVCDLCLRYAFEFNEDEPILYENRGKERVHNIINLVKGDYFPPFHPLCRCTYLSVWASKGKPPENPYIISLTPSSYDGLSALFGFSIIDGKEFSDESLPPLNEIMFKEKIKGFVNEGDLNLLSNFLKSFINQVPNVHYEFGAANIVGTINLGFGDWDKEIKLPEVLKELGVQFNIPILIHNHPYNTSPFPSSYDFISYAKYGVKYGIVTNDLGTFIVKNNNVSGNKKEYGDIEKPIKDIKIGIIEEFEEKYGYEYDENNKSHNKNISRMVNENSEKYREQYQKALNNFDMEVMFIKNENYK